MILNKDIIFVIPAFNEDKTLPIIISSLKRYGNIVVVDDFSSDNTFSVAKRMGVFVLRNKRNIGYEKTLLRGLQWSKRKKYKWAITLDADGQHPLNSILIIKESISDNFDLIIGARNKLGRIAEYAIGGFFKIKWNISDPLSGLKAYKLKKTNSFLTTYNSFGLEFLINLLNSNVVFKEIYIDVLDREDKSRLGSVLKVNISMIKLLFKIMKENLHN
jgi:glycosyltransferase involved in cell wall biosynthesis